MGKNCRFSPVCSTYGIMVIKMYGPWRGGWMALKRVLRCHPWSKGGLDYPPTSHKH
ncbi:membrane protein insertion efficiency factor YidD [Swingsia samuiensis]